jgi:secreted trypsin-like serine protease
MRFRLLFVALILYFMTSDETIDTTDKKIGNSIPLSEHSLSLFPQLPSGELKVSPKIVQPDSQLTAGAYRFFASIQQADLPPADGHFCGAVLISKRWAVTAAHCLSLRSAAEIKLKVDFEYLTDLKGTVIKAKRIVTHQSFNKTAHNSFLNDIALIELDDTAPSDIEFPKMLSPDMEKKILEGSPYVPEIIGCGKNAFSRYSAITNYPRRTSVKVISNEQCNKENYFGLINDFEMCAGLEGADACQGDSGGPLILWDDDAGFLLLGLVSWGEGCGLKHKPGVYVRLSAFKEWIEKYAK